MGQLRSFWRKCKRQAPLARFHGIEGYGPLLDKIEAKFRELEKAFPAFVIKLNAKGGAAADAQGRKVLKICEELKALSASLGRQSDQLSRAGQASASQSKNGGAQAGFRTQQIAFLMLVSRELQRLYSDLLRSAADDALLWIQSLSEDDVGFVHPPNLQQVRRQFDQGLAALDRSAIRANLKQ